MLSSALQSSFKSLHFAFFLRCAIQALRFPWIDKTHTDGRHNGVSLARGFVK